MADIFISYARADRDKIEKLATALEAEGYSVWWDRNIVGGSEFSEEIEKELTAAKAVIVAWSEDSVKSRWVRDEAGTAAEANKLIPIGLDDAAAPMGFKQYHVIDIDGWNGKPDASEFHDVARAVKARLTGEAPPPATESKGVFARIFSKQKKDSLPMTALKGVIAVAIVFVAVKYTGPKTVIRETAPNTVIADEEGATEETALSDAAAQTPESASIAVLPFADLSPEGDQEYFSDGIAEEILNVLAGVDGLNVASRTSSFQFKGQAAIGVPIIAEQLNVRHILEGSVRKAGDTVRITAQLIDAETDKHLWSETFDRTLTTNNLFTVQDEITKAIVDQLSNQMSGPNAIGAPTARTADTDDADAYALYLEGHTRFVRRGSENIKRSIAALERAVEIDPGFTRAWSALSGVYNVGPSWLGGADLNRDFSLLATDAARNAIALDPSQSLPYAVLASVSQDEGDYDTAFANYATAIANDPRNEIAYGWRGEMWHALGFFDKSRADFDMCLTLNPDYNNCRNIKGSLQIAMGDVDAGLATIHENMQRGFDGGVNADVLGAYLDQGNEAAVLYELNKLPRYLGEGDLRWTVDLMYQALTDPANDKAAALRLFEARLDSMGLKLFARSEIGSMIFLIFGAYEEFGRTNRSLVWQTTGFPEWTASPERKRLMRVAKLDSFWRAHGFPPQCRPIGDDDFECE